MGRLPLPEGRGQTPTAGLVSRASRIFPSGVRMRVNKFCVGGEGNIRLVTVARFSYRGGM